MRKLFFSLVATLAFGSFAMANNLDVKTVEAVSVENLFNIDENFISYQLFEEDCDAVYTNVRDAHIAEGFSHRDAVKAATLAFSRCTNPEYHQSTSLAP